MGNFQVRGPFSESEVVDIFHYPKENLNLENKIDRLDSVLLANSIEKYIDNQKTTEYLLPDGKVAEMSEKIEDILA